MDEIERIRRYFAAAGRRSLRNDGSRRSYIPVTARHHLGTEPLQGVEYQQGIVHIATRGTDVHHHPRSLYRRHGSQRLRETGIGSHPPSGLQKLRLFRNPYHSLYVYDSLGRAAVNPDI